MNLISETEQVHLEIYDALNGIIQQILRFGKLAPVCSTGRQQLHYDTSDVPFWC
jgi:hypothetical protein